MAQFDQEILQTLTQLSRIKCNEETFEKLLTHLKSILNYMDLLREVDTEGALECHHVLETISNVMREDQVEKTLETKTFLLNSPSHTGGMIRVPPVIKF